MGLTAVTLKMISGVLPGKRVLSLGYPDLAMSAEDVQAILGVTPTKFTAKEQARWHGLDHQMPETAHVFDLIGSTLDCVDVSPSRGVERVADLNHPCALGEYDFVLDCGTTEHCFNVGQALINAANAVRPNGGLIFHCFPMCVMNHGFWNASPTMFNDFYSQNGWSVKMAGMVHGTGDCYTVPAHKAFTPEPRMYLTAFAVRKEKSPMRFPTQQKYLRFPTLTRKVA